MFTDLVIQRADNGRSNDTVRFYVAADRFPLGPGGPIADEAAALELLVRAADLTTDQAEAALRLAERLNGRAVIIPCLSTEIRL